MAANNRPTPKLKKGVTLYPYQTEVIKWMEAREKAKPALNRGITGGLVCLKMGLGKTLTALQHSLQAQKINNEEYPTLVIASKTVMYEWKKQGIEKFYDNINALFLHKDFMGKNIKTITSKELLKYNIVVTTYDQCVSACKEHKAEKLICEYGTEGIHKDKVVAIHKPKNPTYKPKTVGTINIYKFPWARVICDESQRFANPATFTFKAIMAIYAEHTWCLTGTPIRNYDADIWSQLRFCGYDTIAAARLWKREYFKGQNLKQYVYETDYEKENIKMPARHEYAHYVDMDPDQKLTYEALLVETQNLYEQMLMKFINYASVLAMFTRLRQVCIAPYLIVSKKKNKNNAAIQKGIDKALVKSKVDKWITDDTGSAGIDSPKIKKIVDIISKVPAGEKIILFSMFTSCLEIVEQAMKIDLPDTCYAFLDGSTTGQERIDILTCFKENPKVTVMLVHYKVGGEGLNLIESNHVICIEPWWSPAVHNQAIARCWRRGQQKPVHVHWIITWRTIEQPILKMCGNKNQLSDFYMHDEEYNPQPVGLTKGAMQLLLGEALTINMMEELGAGYITGDNVINTGHTVSKGYLLGTADPVEAVDTVDTVESADSDSTESVDELDSLCKICFKKNINTAAVPCGHTCMCIGCSAKIMAYNAKCPICTQTMNSVLKLFKA